MSLLAIAWDQTYNPQYFPEKFELIVNKCCEHRPWFPDYWWEDERIRRTVVVQTLSSSYIDGRVWEVLRDGELLGILLVNDLRAALDAQCHFIFFDHELRSKRQLILSAMQDTFHRFSLETLRIEIPTYAAKLATFARRALGFKFEAEWLGASPDEAERLSRKFRHTLYEGKWHDALLLSVTKDGFASFLEDGSQRTQTS